RIGRADERASRLDDRIVRTRVRWLGLVEETHLADPLHHESTHRLVLLLGIPWGSDRARLAPRRMSDRNRLEDHPQACTKRRGDDGEIARIAPRRRPSAHA